MYIDLLQIQRFSFLKFLQNGINQVFDNINPIIIANRKYVFFSKYYLLKIPSQINFISINNQFEPSKDVDEPSTSNLLSSHSIFDILSSNQLSRISSQIRYGPSYLNSNFYFPMSSVKYAQWIKMSRIRTQILQKCSSENPMDHYNKIWWFKGNSIPSHLNFSSSFSSLGMEKWRDAKPIKRLKTEYYHENKIFSSIVKTNLPRFAQLSKIMTKSSIKTIPSNFFSKPNDSFLLDSINTKQWLEKNQWSGSTYRFTPSKIMEWDPRFKKTVNISSTNLSKAPQLTYSSEFYIPVQIIDQISKKMYLRWLLLADLPIQTKRGHFIINGYPKTVIHQIVRSPGIRFKNEDNQILADIISMRGAWMGIQIVYEKNLKATTFGFKRQNKMVNKPTFQRSSTKLDKNLTLTNERRKNLSSVNEENIKPNVPGNFFSQSNSYKYGTSFMQDTIIKSEKIDHLPPSRLNLLKAQYENRTLEKLRYWPGIFFYPQAINSFSGSDSSTHFLRRKESSIQEIYEKLVGYPTKNQLGSGSKGFTPSEAMGWDPTKHHFWNCPFWTITNYQDKAVSSPIMKSGFDRKPVSSMTPKFFKFPLNSIKESEKIHEALSINFFISSSRTDKTDKKRIKLSGFAFLDYLFDHPYFIYNNYVPSWQRSSFFPASVFKNLLNMDPYTKTFSSFRKYFDYNLVSDKIWPIFKGRTHRQSLYRKAGIHQKAKTTITSIIQNEPKSRKQLSPKAVSSQSLIQGSHNGFFKSYGRTSPVVSRKLFSLQENTRCMKPWGRTQRFKTMTDLFINGSLASDESDALVSQNPLLWFRTYALLNENTHTELLAKENYPPYFTTSDTLLKTLTWRLFKKIKQTRFSKIWPCLIQELPLKTYPLPNDPNIFVLNGLKQGRVYALNGLNHGYSETGISLFGSYPIVEPGVKGQAPPEKETDNSFLVENTNQSNNGRDFSMKMNTHDNIDGKVSMIQNKNASLWIKTPVINNGVPNIQLETHKNMYKKYLNVMKTNIGIQKQNSLGYRDNLQVLKPVQPGSVYPEFDKQSHACLEPGSKQAWTNEFVSKQLIRSKTIVSSNRLLASLVSILNTTNFRDVLFERFMNAKFYDIGLMGRKRLNKKLRLNVPLQCTTLTPLDFLAIFYKLFSLYNNFSLIQNFFPTEGRTPLKIPFLGDSFALSPKANPSSDSKLEMYRSSGSVAFRQLMSINIRGNTLPISSPGVGNVLKPRNNLLNSTLKQTSSLDHLNQRHIRTSGEFLFLQFWRAILRFYQILSQLSSRSNFIKSSYTAAGKTGRNFFSLSSISLFPSIESSVSDQIEYILPISNNQTHVLKAYGYFNTINPRDDAFNFNSYQYQCFQNTMSGEFVVNSNRTTLFPNKMVGSSPHNFRRETLNIVINRNDLNSILPYTPYFQASSVYDYDYSPKTGSYLKFLNTGAKKIVSTSAQFQNFALKQNENNSAYVQYDRSFFRKINNRQNSHIRSMVDNFILMAPKYLGIPPSLRLEKTDRRNLTKRPKKKRWWPILTKAKNKPLRSKPSKNGNNRNGSFLASSVETPFNKTRVRVFNGLEVLDRRFDSCFSTSVFFNRFKNTNAFVFKRFLKTNVYRSNLMAYKAFSNKNYLVPHRVWPSLIKKPNFFRGILTLKWSQKLRPIMKSDSNQAKFLASLISREEAKNSVSSLDKLPFNSKYETIIKKLLYETKELRVFDAKERMRNLETKLFNGVFKEFFNLDPLSQDLDETNGLSEIIHKRRISALGKGGVTSKNAPLSIRSIHPSFYGRLCPIDSPEGDRVGLINSLTNYARINSIGYIATPFYRTHHHDHLQPYVNRKHEKFSLNQSELANQYYKENTLPGFSRWSTDKNQKMNNNYNTRIIPPAKPSAKTQISLLGREPGEISLLAKKSTLQMRICPPIAFFGKIYNSHNVSPSVRLSFQDSIYNLDKTKETIKSNQSKQSHAKQMLFHIGSTHIERAYKYFMKSSYLRPYQIKSFPLETSLFKSRSIISNPFIYRSRQSHFKSIGIHDFKRALEPMPSFGLTKTQQRGPAYSDLIALPRNLKETVQNKWYYNKDNQKILRKLELFLFYDTHYMTPPITHHETIINNANDRSMGHIYTPFLICYFDFISFQGYAPITAFQFFSPGVGLIPFLEHDDGTRALMGANMQRQAVPLILASRPIVGTGLEKNIAASFIISSTRSGYLYYISGKQSKQIFTGFRPPVDQFNRAYDFKSLDLTTSKQVADSTRREGNNDLLGPTPSLRLEWNHRRSRKIDHQFSPFGSDRQTVLFKPAPFVYNDKQRPGPCFFTRFWPPRMLKRQTFSPTKIKSLKEGYHFILNTHWLPYRKSYKATIINKKPATFENSWLQKGDLLVDGTSSINGELALGRNLFSIYMPWEGYNFEDAILISDKAAQAYTTIHVEEFSVKISKNEFVSSIVKPFTWVNLGDILVSKKRKLENEFIMNRLLFGMSSKPKMKNLDNNFIFDTVSNYNFYGDELKTFVEKQAFSASFVKTPFNKRRVRVFDIKNVKNTDADYRSLSKFNDYREMLVSSLPKRQAFSASSKKKMSGYIVLPWQHKLSGFTCRSTPYEAIRRDPSNNNKRTPNFTKTLTLINSSSKENWSKDQKFNLPISFYDQSNLHEHDFIIKQESGLKRNNSLNQTKMFWFYKTKPNNILKAKYNYETDTLSNSVNPFKSQLEFHSWKENQFLEKISSSAQALNVSLQRKQWGGTQKMWQPRSQKVASRVLGLSNLTSFVYYNKQKMLKDKKTIFTDPYSNYKKTNNPKWLLPSFKSYCFLQNLGELNKKSSNQKQVFYCRYEAFLIRRIHRFPSNLENPSNMENPSNIINDRSQLRSPFYKVSISGETSSVTEQKSISNGEINLDTARIFDDKQSSLFRMNEKDLQVLGSQSSIGGSLKKNDNFEIDTSYRTGESICGWVISVKSQSQQSLFSDSENKDRVHVLNDSKHGRVYNLKNTLNHRGSEISNENFSTLKTESKIDPSPKRVVGIYTGSIRKFLSLLLLFRKNVQLKNNVVHEIRELWTKSFTHQKGKTAIFQAPFGLSKKVNPIGYLLLKNIFGNSHFGWKFPKKANNTYLEWSVGDEKPQSLKNLPFRSPSRINDETKLSFPHVNPHTVEKVKTEGAQLKITKKSRQPPGGDTIYIYIAVAKPLQVGDKMSGRHGNKGIISKILPFYDMPYLIDGTPIDIVLNPLGVPSRMNVGQIYESLLGLTGFYKQEYYRIPPFDENYSSQFSRNFVYWKLNELKDLHFFTPGISSKSSMNNVTNINGSLPFLDLQVGSLKTSISGFRFWNFYFGWSRSKQKSTSFVKTPFNSVFNIFSVLNKGFDNRSLSKLNDYREMLGSSSGSKRFTPNEAMGWDPTKSQAFSADYRSRNVGLFSMNQQFLNDNREKEPFRSKPSKIGQDRNGSFSATTSKLLKITKYLGAQFGDSKSLKYGGVFCLKTFKQKMLDNDFYHASKTLCCYPKSKRWNLSNTSLTINWNTSLLWCPKFSIWDPSNNFSKPKSFKIIFNNSIPLFKSDLKKRWFRSKQVVNNFPSYVQKHRLDKLFINKNRPRVEKFGLNPYFPGKMRLLNGLTGETFYRPIIVGKSYMLKLIHLVHHKIHARATGPYALITQQPLKGKRNQGGQRMGEMEIWALYGFGSASILYEMLTIKSDDPVGRERILREIAGLKGNSSSNSNWKNNENGTALSLRESTQFWKNEESVLGSKANDSLEKGISESFRVLVMNLRALCLDMQVFKDLPN